MKNNIILIVLSILTIFGFGLTFAGNIVSIGHGGSNMIDCIEKPSIVEELESQWGEGSANIYWNENGAVVITYDGYVSEFTLNGSTIHTGFIQ